MSKFLASKTERLVTFLLLCEIAAFYAYPKQDLPREAARLTNVGIHIGDWTRESEYQTEPEIQQVLKADDTLNRTYVNDRTLQRASLFVAFFKSQTTGVAPHSPRNCLPGAGWVYSHFKALPLSIPGIAEPIVVNRYTIERGEMRSVTLYWYQTGTRVIGDEYMAKLYTVGDRLWHRRSDTSLVRVIVPIGDNEAASEEAATNFVRAIYPALNGVLPN